MKQIISSLLLLVVCIGILPSEANAALSFGVRPAFPREDNDRTESIFVHTAEAGTTINEGVRVINNSGEEKHLLLYARDSAPSTGGGFACGQISDIATGVGSWIRFDLSTFAIIEEAPSEDSEERAVETPDVEVPPVVTVVPPVYVDGVTLGSVPGSVDIVIPAGKDLLVPFTISVPANAQVGESNGCILIQEIKPQEAESGVSLSMRSGLRVAMTVPGDIERNLIFSQFRLNKRDGGIFFLPSVKNIGNVSVDTDVLVDVRYFFGKQYEQFGGQFPILRGETYEFNFEMKPTFWGGLYSARAQFSYDKNDSAQVGLNTGGALTTVESKKLWFFMIPSLPGLAIEVGVLALLILLVLFARRTLGVAKMRKSWTPITIKKKSSAIDFANERGIPYAVFVRVNGLRAPYFLFNGQTVLAPATAKKQTPAKKPSRKTKKPTRVATKKAPVKKARRVSRAKKSERSQADSEIT